MTQEFVTLPREVVEQALEALINEGEFRKLLKPLIEKSIDSIRAALDQPQVEQPAMTPIAQRKLEDLMASGYTISGYSVYREQKHQHGFVTGAGLVGWWKPEGMEYPQPKRQPLTDEQIVALDEQALKAFMTARPRRGGYCELFVRAIEAAHNIK